MAGKLATFTATTVHKNSNSLPLPRPRRGKWGGATTTATRVNMLRHFTARRQYPRKTVQRVYCTNCKTPTGYLLVVCAVLSVSLLIFWLRMQQQTFCGCRVKKCTHRHANTHTHTQAHTQIRIHRHTQRFTHIKGNLSKATKYLIENLFCVYQLPSLWCVLMVSVLVKTCIK